LNQAGGGKDAPAPVLDPFAYGCRTLINMRTCISCGDPISEKKRKDAKYCDKAACRGREYRKRQAETANANATRHAHPASTVLTCSCGKRYLLQVCALDGPVPGLATELSSANSAPQAVTQTVLLTDQWPGEPAARADVAATAPEALTQTVLRTDGRPAEEPSTAPSGTGGAEALTQTDRTGQSATDLVTLELHFTDRAERRSPFALAVHRQKDGRWALRPNAQVAFSLGEPGRPCLGGRPGAWRKSYGDRSPSEFGYDPDLAVMFWDQKSRRGRAASANVLRDLLGDGWKERLREIRDGRL
jgi:hypothetical protein